MILLKDLDVGRFSMRTPSKLHLIALREDNRALFVAVVAVIETLSVGASN